VAAYEREKPFPAPAVALTECSRRGLHTGTSGDRRPVITRFSAVVGLRSVPDAPPATLTRWPNKVAVMKWR
jgi:hypothetical protein